MEGPTLVVAPSSAMWQWHDEVIRSTAPGTLKIAMFYGGKRSSINFSEADVVITTYPVLEFEYRKQCDRTKVRCAFCEKAMLPRKLELHYKYFCGPFAQRSAKQAKTERKGQSQEVINKGLATLGVNVAGKGASASASQIKARPPRKPKTAYIMWKVMVSKGEAAESRGKGAAGSGSSAGMQARWKELDAASKAPFEEAAKADKACYDNEMAEYQSMAAEPPGASSKTKTGGGEGAVSPGSGRKEKEKKSTTFAASVPTLTNIYREIMSDAKREDEIVTMYEPRSKSGGDPTGGIGSSSSSSSSSSTTEDCSSGSTSATDPAAASPALELESMLGLKVQKSFAEGFFDGIVTARDAETGYWEVHLILIRRNCSLRIALKLLYG